MAGERKPMLGPVGRQVVRNIKELTRIRGLSLRDLSARLDELGCPVLPSVLHRLVKEERRVDADDLMAFALALGVNPNALLLPRDTAPGHDVELTPEERISAWSAWAWADGRIPLPLQAGSGTPAGERFTREVDFARNARPAFGGQGSEAVFELYELADRLEAYLGTGDLAVRDVLRDRVLRQVRQVVLRLEEALADDDAAVQLRNAAGTLPAPEVDYAGPREAGK